MMVTLFADADEFGCGNINITERNIKTKWHSYQKDVC